MLFCSILEVHSFFGGHYASMCLELDFLEPALASACIINNPGALIFVTWALKKRQ
jgi:hypothetical protein